MRAILICMTRLARSIAFASALALASASAAWCDEYYSDRGFSVDVPEGFEYLDGDGQSKFSFGSPDGSVRLDILVYPPNRFDGARAGAADTAKRLSGKGDFAVFDYAGRSAAFGELAFGSGSGAQRGYGLFVDDAASPLGGVSAPLGASTKVGVPEAERRYDLIVLAYAPASSFEGYRDVVASAMDGFSLNVEARASPGPLGLAARAALGAPRLQPATIRFGAASIRSEWQPLEAAASQALVEREYRVLSAYASSPELIDAAIARFYRMVFRDAAPALDRLALQLSAAWETGAWDGKPRAPSPAALDSGAASAPPTALDGARFGAPADPRGYAAALLGWVQGFRYERDPKGSDVVNPISAAFEARGDCDSRALVMAILLRRENIRSILMISLVHEHALAAVDAPGPGARYPFRGQQWLVAETTAKVGIGLIDAAQADPSGWIGVEFPR